MKKLSLLQYFCFLTILGSLLLALPALATHIKAGEITVRRIDPQSFTFEITVTGYTDRDSQVLFGSNGLLHFGDGTTRELRNPGLLDPVHPDYFERVLVDENTWKWTKTFMHTYPSARSYTISVRELYRNEGLLNVDNSVLMPFYIETSITIDPFLGSNSTPELEKPPVQEAFVGKTFHHQPGATDADGDSLSYRIVPCHQDQGKAVDNFRLPHLTFPAGDPRNGSQEGGGLPIFSINPKTGDIVWDAPGTTGEYCVALVVQEWRKVNGTYYSLGYVTRDMVIIVNEDETDSGGRFPRLSFPTLNNTLAPAQGTPVSWTITAQANNPADEVVLEIWGDFLQKTDAVASATRVQAVGEASITITWTGEENEGQNYQLIAHSYQAGMEAYPRSRSTFIYHDPLTLGIGNPSVTPVEIYPNPLSGTTLYLNLPEAVGKEVKVWLYDMKGKLIQHESAMVVQNQQPFNLHNPAKGVYLLLLQYQGKLYRNKLIIP